MTAIGIQTRAEIVLMGPVRAGKSTVGRLLAERLGKKQVSLDAIRHAYYREIGFDDQFAQEVRRECGFLGLVLYWNLFDAYAVERMLAEYRDCIFDFGGGIYESTESLARVKRALTPVANVVLLLPSADPEETQRILKERDLNPPADIAYNYLRRGLSHPTYQELPKWTVYTAGKTPEETRDEILNRAQSAGGKL